MTAPHNDPTNQQSILGLLQRLLGRWRQQTSSIGLNDDIINGRGGARTAFRLAWPSIFEMVMVSMVQYVDAAMVGRLGASCMAAVGLSMPMTWIINGCMTWPSVSAPRTRRPPVGARQFSRPRQSPAKLLSWALPLAWSAHLPSLAGNAIPTMLGAQPEFHRTPPPISGFSAAGWFPASLPSS